MSKKKGIIIVASLMVFIAISDENEFLKPAKEKRFYPSCTQCLELKAVKIAAINDARDILHRLNGLLNEAEKADIAAITSYVDGDKGCFLQQATKKQRAQEWEHDQKLKQVIVTIGNDTKKVITRLNEAISTPF